MGKDRAGCAVHIISDGLREMRSPARGTSGRRAHLSSVQMSFGWTTESWEQNHEGPSQEAVSREGLLRAKTCRVFSSVLMNYRK